MLASTKRSERKVRLRSMCCNFMTVRCVYVERGRVEDCMCGRQNQAVKLPEESWVIQICGEGRSVEDFARAETERIRNAPAQLARKRNGK